MRIKSQTFSTTHLLTLPLYLNTPNSNRNCLGLHSALLVLYYN